MCHCVCSIFITHSCIVYWVTFKKIFLHHFHKSRFVPQSCLRTCDFANVVYGKFGKMWKTVFRAKEWLRVSAIWIVSHGIGYIQAYVASVCHLESRGLMSFILICISTKYAVRDCDNDYAQNRRHNWFISSNTTPCRNCFRGKKFIKVENFFRNISFSSFNVVFIFL